MRKPLLHAAAIIVALIACSLFGSSLAYAYESVQIPLDQSDKRLGKFYVKSLDGQLFRPAERGPVPTIIFLHGCGGIGGLTLEAVQDRANHFVSLGYASLILDVDDNRHLGERMCRERQIAFAMLDARRADIDAAVDWLVTEKVSDRQMIVAIGYSHGAEVVVEHNQKADNAALITGGIAYYPACDRGTPKVKYPLLILVGDQDFSDGPKRSLGPVCSDYVRAANAGGKVKSEVVVYPGSGHGFDVPGLPEQVSQGLNKTRAGYQKAAADASFQKVDEFLARVFH